jgi:PAS domain S-box-containing protein
METPESASRPAAPSATSWTSDNKYRVLFDSIDEGFCVIEVLFDAGTKPIDYRFIETNPAFERHTGLGDALGRRMRELVPDHDEHWFRIYGEVALTGRSIRFENRAEAMRRWYDVYAFRVGEPEQRLVGLLFNDISQRKLAEQALKAADRRKDEFIAILAHELRNPLAPIRNALQVMKLAANDPETVERSREMMERQVSHMVTLVNDLMDASRITRGLVELDRQPLDLAFVVRQATEAAEPAIRQQQHTLSIQLPSEPVRVHGDPVRLTQALSNLLTNAAKYTPADGQIAITVKKDGPRALVAVSDNGIGIPADMLEQVFDLFIQTPLSRELAQGGLGIGLSLVKQVVALHGGTVEAASDGPGRGSQFKVWLPLLASAAESAADSRAATAIAATPNARRVLVVDDNVDAAESIAMVLRLLGHDVQTAFDGERALQLAEREHPEVVLLDIGMPGMDGMTLARHLRARPWAQASTLVALTGWAREADHEASHNAGFDHHLAKPIAPEALEALIAGRPLLQ